MISNEYEYLILELCETWQSPAKIQNHVPNGDLVMIYHSSTDNTDKTNHLLNTSKHTWSHKNPFWKCSKAVDCTIYFHLHVFSTQPPTLIHNNQPKHTSFPHRSYPWSIPGKIPPGCCPNPSLLPWRVCARGVGDDFFENFGKFFWEAPMSRRSRSLLYFVCLHGF